MAIEKIAAMVSTLAKLRDEDGALDANVYSDPQRSVIRLKRSPVEIAFEGATLAEALTKTVQYLRDAIKANRDEAQGRIDDLKKAIDEADKA